jgi:hypothetical protein
MPHAAPREQESTCTFRRLLLHFDRLSQLHYAFKTLAYTMINLRHYCQS